MGRLEIVRNRILNVDNLLSHGNTEAKGIALDILESGLQAADPYSKICRLISREGDVLRIGDPIFEPYGDPRAGQAEVVDLSLIGRVYLFVWGKGLQRAGKAVEDILGDRLDGGHVVAKHGDGVIMERCGVTLAGHPVPDSDCVRGCETIVSMCRELDFKENDLVITIVGNGVSSLMTYPAGGMSIDDVGEITRIMQIELGVTTFELNHIRNHVDRLKGGRINRYFGKAKLINIAFCSPNMLHGEGVYSRGYGYDACMRTNRWLHTWPDDSTFADAMEIVKKWDAEDRLPASVMKYLRSAPPCDETMKPGEFEKLNARIYGMSPIELQPVSVCRSRAAELGFEARVINKRYECEAAPSGFLVGNIARLCERDDEPFRTPCVLLSTGELIVSVGDSGGVGGRNQEFALSAALSIAGSNHIAIAAADTDGTDGPGGHFNEEASSRGITCLAGGVVDGFTADRANEKGVDIFRAIKSHATSDALWRLGCGIHASQNMAIGDLHVVVITGGETCGIPWEKN
jgi:glycerate-2-kinase